MAIDERADKAEIESVGPGSAAVQDGRLIPDPEHRKLKAVSGKSQIIGEFLDWLEHEDGATICKLRDEDYCPTYEKIEDLLARYFDIDQNKLEAEKRRMLRDLRNSG